jgi:hypothetical protein
MYTVQIAHVGNVVRVEDAHLRPFNKLIHILVFSSPSPYQNHFDIVNLMLVEPLDHSGPWIERWFRVSPTRRSPTWQPWYSTVVDGARSRPEKARETAGDAIGR